MSHITQREAFEAWHGPHGLSRSNAPGDDLDGYQCSHTNMAWKAWQAALAHPDCRTCNNLDSCKEDAKWMRNYCTNGDKYQPAPKVVLWRTE